MQHAEHTLWLALCEHLVKQRAVTRMDLERPVGETNTMGMYLLDKIRTWGEARSNLFVAAQGRKENA